LTNVVARLKLDADIMIRNAALNPLIAVLVGIGWIVVKALMNRREDAESWDEPTVPPAPRPHVPDRDQGTPPSRIPTPGPKALPPPIRPVIAQNPPRAPQSSPVIRTFPAPVTRPVIVHEPAAVQPGKLIQSQESYGRATHLHEAVAQRLSAIDQLTATAKPIAPKVRERSAAAAHVLRTFRHPVTARQAFLASFVLNPPKALE
jgi:hypothetical protein